MIDVLYDTYTERMLDRTFEACRVVLQESPLADSVAVSAVARQSHLPCELTKECMRRLSCDGIIFHRDGKYTLARKASLA